MKNILEVENLYKEFPLRGKKKAVHAVNGISFHIEPGETLGLVGESGSGKTTVGRCIVGLETFSQGKVLVDGHQVSDTMAGSERAKLKGRIQMVFQEPLESLDSRFRIGRSLEEPLRSLHVEPSARRSRVRDTIEKVGLTVEHLDLYPAEISAGQQQRVGIARAMVTNPSLIVLDEPTSSLDPTARAEIIDLLIQLQKEQGTAYLFISHDLNTVRFVSHRVAVMYLGMIVEQGFTPEIFSAPRHPYSVGLLSSVLLPNPDIRFETNLQLSGEIPSPVNLPTGCFLAARCPLATEKCFIERPAGVDLGDSHIVHCFHHDEVARLERPSDTFEKFQAETERTLAISRLSNQ